MDIHNLFYGSLHFHKCAVLTRYFWFAVCRISIATVAWVF